MANPINSAILFSLNVLDRFTLDQVWNLLGQPPDFAKKKLPLRTMLILISVVTLISKFSVFGAQKTPSWAYRSH